LENPIRPPEALVEELSTEGRELFELMQKMVVTPAEAAEAMLVMSPQDHATFSKIERYLREAYQIELEHHKEGYRQSQLAQYVFRRASTLAPGSIGDDTLLEEAIRLLERHGEKPPEDLDLDRIEEVPIDPE
jgi:hypothetical protein